MLLLLGATYFNLDNCVPLPWEVTNITLNTGKCNKGQSPLTSLSSFSFCNYSEMESPTIPILADRLDSRAAKSRCVQYRTALKYYKCR